MNSSAILGAPPSASTARSVRVVLGLARYTMLEAWRGRWPVAAGLAAAAVGVALAFAGATALTERTGVALSLAAPLARIAAVLVVAVFAIAALSREVADGSVELALAAPLSRLSWLAGRWLGVAGIAAATAVAVAAPLAPAAPAAALAAWTASLWLEGVLVGGVAILLAISFAQVPAALLSLLAFYTMSRLVGVVMLLNARAPLEAPALLSTIGDALIGALGLLLPRLDLFTRTEWLLDADAPLAGAGLAPLQLAVWIVLVPAVGWLDFRSRRG